MQDIWKPRRMFEFTTDSRFPALGRRCPGRAWVHGSGCSPVLTLPPSFQARLPASLWQAAPWDKNKAGTRLRVREKFKELCSERTRARSGHRASLCCRMTEVTGKRSKSKTEAGQNKGGREDIPRSKAGEWETRRNMKQEVGGLILDNRQGGHELVDRYPL